MGWSNQVIQAQIILLTGNGDGAFAYNGTPALGNPPIAWLTGGGLVDPYGNVLPSQMGVEGNGIFTSTGGAGQSALAGNLLSIVPTGGASSAIFGAPSPGAAYMVSGTEPGTDAEAFLYLLSKLASGSFDAPQAILTGVLTASLPGGGATQEETWHTMTLLNGWNIGTGYAQYKMEPNGRVSIRGANITPGTVTSGTSIWTPPTGYAPTLVRQDIGLIIEAGTQAYSADYPRFDAEASGLLVQNLTSSTTRVGWNDSYALD
jgi:hypothetical protein